MYSPHLCLWTLFVSPPLSFLLLSNITNNLLKHGIPPTPPPLPSSVETMGAPEGQTAHRAPPQPPFRHRWQAGEALGRRNKRQKITSSHAKVGVTTQFSPKQQQRNVYLYVCMANNSLANNRKKKEREKGTDAKRANTISTWRWTGPQHTHFLAQNIGGFTRLAIS